MPRAMDPELRDCLERANPYTEYRIEVSEPDVQHVLRRADQFTTAPTLVSMSPALSLSASARGALIMTPTLGALASFTAVNSSYDLNGENPQRRLKGLSWIMDAAFSRAILKSVQAKVERVSIAGFYFDTDFECQVFRITKTPGVKVKNVGTPQYQATAFTEFTFTPLLNPPPIRKASQQAWDGSQRTTLNFDLANYNLAVENTPSRASSPDQVGELPEYLIVVRLAGKPLSGTGHFKWITDTTTTRTIAGLGTFERVFWARDNDEQQWARNAFADVPNVTLNVETYGASSQGVYALDLLAVPNADSIGRVVFERSLPNGTNATLEISTAGSGGAWTAVKNGDLVATKQQTYHLRVTLTSDASGRASPEVNALGIEFRTPHDVSIEGVPELPTREVALPWPAASIAEGKLRVVRTGIRDYADIASVLGSSAPTSRLEADIYLASRHPSITRDKWLHLERLMVTNRLPTPTSELFTLLSYGSRLKRKIPQKKETLSSVHSVISGTTTAQVKIDSANPLPGTTVSGNEYDGKGYYMRVRSTSTTNVPVGFVQVIQGNTNIDRLDFSPALPEALAVGDVIEVHSGVFQTDAVSWADADPADVWWDLLTIQLQIPPERIGLGSLPRGGKPPKVTDIAPADATTQAKLKVTVRLAEQESGDELLDQMSAIMGGVTIELGAGQIVFVQIMPLFDLGGVVTVPLPEVVAVFDSRDIGTLSTPLGLEKRTTVVSANYGVPATAASPDSFPKKTTTAVDADALLWLATQDLEQSGTTEVPEEIARWLYNTADGGLYLASVIGTRLVRVGATGLRVFSLGMAEKHPRLLPGDVIVINTDGYTDYDPSTRTSLKGPMAIRGVLVKVGAEGRTLGMFVTGLIDNVTLPQGGKAGALAQQALPQQPTILLVKKTGTILDVLGDTANTKSIRVYDTLGTWEYVLDAPGATIDVSKPGTNAVAGLGASSSTTFRVQLRSDSTSEITGDTLITEQDIVISGPSYPAPGALWDTPGLLLSAPSVGSSLMGITLKATAAPAGWDVKIYIGTAPNPTGDHTADLSPALSAPPTSSTAYTYDTEHIAVHDPPRIMKTYYVKANLRNGSGTVIDTRTAQISYYASTLV